MVTTLQPVLSCGESASSDVSVFLSRSGTTYEVYVGVALLERVGADPAVIGHKMLVGRLYNAGVSLRELSASFYHDSRTVKIWGEAMLSGDIEVMACAFTGRGGAGKVTPELIRYARQLYRNRHSLGRNYRQIIIDRIQEVFQVSISATTASAMFRSEVEHSIDTGNPGKVVTTLQDAPVLSSKTASSVKRSPTPLPSQTTAFGNAGEQLIHHAGLALFANGMSGFSDPLQRQLLAQILQGAVNVEQSKTLCGRSLANFTGPIISGLKEQRDGIDAQACPEGIRQVYELNAELLADGPNRGDIFYFDPHSKEYTGQLKVLKGWCGNRHGIAKIINMDSFHTRSGRPCFIQHYSPYYDMRERFFMSLRRFDQLFDADKRQRRSFVIDRGIYGLTALQSFGKDYVITWEKNYSGGGWGDHRPSLTFTRSRTKNHNSDFHFITFQCQESVWRRDPSFRRIIVRVSQSGRKDIEVSIITSHPNMDIEDVVWAIFRRWLQENDFKYLNANFGFNQLTSRDSSSFRSEPARFQDRPIDSPEYRSLKNDIHALEAKLGNRLVRLRINEKKQHELEIRKAKLIASQKKLDKRTKRIIDRLKNDASLPRDSKNIHRESNDWRDSCRKVTGQLRTNVSTRTKLQVEIADIEKEIEPMDAKLHNAVRKQSRLQLLTDGDYQLLDTRKKAMMDALRVTASNIFRNVQEQFRAICNNYRDDHVLVRMFSRCSGTMTKTAHATQFRLWLPGTLQPYRIREIKNLLANIEEQTNHAITVGRPIRLTLATGPINV